MPAKKNTTCRYCNSDRFVQLISLGTHPPSNSFISSDQIEQEERYPLELYFCQDCYLVQLLDVVPAEIIFDDYLYLASSSKALKKHYRLLAESLTERFELTAQDVVVDIGCNDGILLHGYSLHDLVRVGIEPSKVASIAANSGLEVVQAFFTPQTAKRIRQQYGGAKIVTATNVFAHVDKVGEFVEGLPILLDDDGVFIAEMPYLIDLVDQILFDTIYHEHLCYLALTPMIGFLAKYGLEVFDVERVPFGASGPAFRVYVRKQDNGTAIQDSVARLLDYESAWGIGDIGRYRQFAQRIDQIKQQVLQIIETVRSSGARIGGYGAPAKGNTLLNYLGITSNLLECVAETNPLKQGLLTPGSHIPIVSEEEFLEMKPDYALLLSWNYLDFFLQKSDYIRRGGKFIVPLPIPKIVP